MSFINIYIYTVDCVIRTFTGHDNSSNYRGSILLYQSTSKGQRTKIELRRVRIIEVRIMEIMLEKNP